MKNTFKITMLFCLVACMLFSTVACNGNVVITPVETGTTDEVTGDGTTPEGTTPNYPEAPVPVESVGFQVVSETEDSYSFRVFIDSTEENAYIDLKPFFNAVLVPAKFPELGFDSVIETFEFLVDDKLADANTKVFNGSIVTFRVKTTLNYPENPVPVESVGFQVVSETEDSYSFRVFIDSAEENAYIDLKPFFDGVLVPAMFPGVSFDFIFATVEFFVDGKPADANTKIVNGSIVTFRAKTTPEETTPEETTPEEITPPDPNEGKAVYQVKVTDENQQPLAGVELQICYGAERISLPATAANGYTVSEFVEIKNYTVRVIRADGYQFDPNFDYPLITGTNVAYIVLVPEVIEDDIVMPEKIDMQGYTYKAYVRDFAGTDPDAHNAQVQNGNNDYRCIDFWVDEANSETDFISYAVYNRNQQIESDYNCKIRQVSSNGSQLEFLVSALQNGTGYDLTIMTAKPAAQAATQNLLQNLKGADYMDLSKPSFDQNSINSLSVGDKLYFLSGDMNISTMDVAGVTLVNMDFYEDIAERIVNELYGGDQMYNNIYDVVAAKKWTMDTMLRIAKLANVDIDRTDGELHVLPNGIVGNVEVDNKYNGGDTVGYHQYLYSALWYFYGSGGRITDKNEDGEFQFVIQSNANADLYDYIFDKFNRKVGVNTWIPHESSNILNMNFLTGYVLFADSSLFNIRNEIFPRAEFEYGILPLPTYEEGMDYQSVVYFNNWAHLWAIPQMVGNQENAERMMEIMAVYSSLEGSTMDAYYERTIYLMAGRENGSREVLDTLRTSLVYDMALLYPSWGRIEDKLVQIPNRETQEYADIIHHISDLEISMYDTIEQLFYAGEW